MIFSLEKNKYGWAGSATPSPAAFDKDNKIAAYFLQVTALCWIVTKMIGWRLWTLDRLIPTAPPFDFLAAPAAVHRLLLAISFVLMFLLVLKPLNRRFAIALVIVELSSCLFDQCRWQPWEYQFIFTLLAYIINYNQPKKIIAGVAFLMVSTYAYSGLGKFSQSFLYLFWESLFLTKYLHLTPAYIHQPLIHYSGYLIPVIELVFGIALLFRPLQKLAAWLLILMHVLIIVMVGPWGLKYNVVVWPWNFLMIAQLYLVFIYKGPAEVNLKEMWKGWNKVILIFWGLLPLLNHTVGWWDNFLSSRLFAGNQPHMMLCIKDSSEKQQLKPYIRKYNPGVPCDSTAVLVNLQTWAMTEIKSPPYIEERVYKKIAARWISEHPGSSTKAFLYYFTSPGKIKIKSQQ